MVPPTQTFRHHALNQINKRENNIYVYIYMYLIFQNNGLVRDL